MSGRDFALIRIGIILLSLQKRRIQKLTLATEVKKYAVIFYLIQWCNITVVSVVGGVLYSWPCVLALS